MINIFLHLQPVGEEREEINIAIDKHYAMCYTLVQVRGIAERSPELDPDTRADLLLRLNDIYRYLRWPIDEQVAEIGGRNN